MAINDYSFITSSVVLLMSLFVLMGLVSFTDRKRKKHLLLSKSYQHLMDDLSLLLTLKKQSFFSSDVSALTKNIGDCCRGQSRPLGRRKGVPSAYRRLTDLYRVFTWAPRREMRFYIASGRD